LLGGDSDFLWGEFLSEIGAVDADEYQKKNQAFVVVKGGEGGGGLCGCDRMVVGFTTYAICAYVVSSNPAHNEEILTPFYLSKICKIANFTENSEYMLNSTLLYIYYFNVSSFQ
jgi:hypothetical protein